MPPPLAAGGQIAGAVIAPAYFGVMPDGRICRHLSVGANRIRGEQHGLAIGVVGPRRACTACRSGLVSWAGQSIRRSSCHSSTHLD
jgi:hypothetical protein